MMDNICFQRCEQLWQCQGEFHKTKQKVHPDKIFFPGILDHTFLVILFKNIKVLHCKYTVSGILNLSDQSMKSDQQVHPGSKMNVV